MHQPIGGQPPHGACPLLHSSKSPPERTSAGHGDGHGDSSFTPKELPNLTGPWPAPQGALQLECQQIRATESASGFGKQCDLT